MGVDVEKAKSALRHEVRERLKALNPAKRSDASAQACALLERQGLWREARSVLLFAPLSEELDIWPLLDKALAAGKAVALPRFSMETDGYVACEVRTPGTEIRLGRFGIREPADSCRQVAMNQLDLILVPGVAFDLNGRRLGRGRGYYDRWLAMARGTTCGTAFEEQIVSEVPIEPHDVHLDRILTPTRWVEL